MNTLLPQALPGTLPQAPVGPSRALLPAAPGMPAPGTPAVAGFFAALQQTALPALWPSVPQEAGGAATATAALLPPLPGNPAGLPAGETLPGPSDEDQPAGDVPAPVLLAPAVFAPIAATPAFQPHGLALLNGAAPWNAVAATALAAPSAPAPAMALPGRAAATATVQQALPSFADAAPQATLLPSPPPFSAAASQALVPQAPLPMQAQTPTQVQVQMPAADQAEAQAAPLEKLLAAHATTSRDAATAAWNPAAADGLPAPLSTPAAAPTAARTDGTQAATALAEALGERIDWQIRRGSERAQIRLDPPMQGQLEITVRRDGTGLQIHLSATHGDVVRQLHAISDSLRGELAMRQTGDVTVTIAQHAPREHDGRGRQAQDNAPEAPGQALAEAEHEQAPQAFALSSTSQRNP